MRCPAPSQAAEWHPGRLGSRAAHQLRGTPGSIPTHASPRLAPPLGSLPRGRVQAVATRSPEMPIFSATLNSPRSRTPRPSALGHRRSPSKSPRAARLPKQRRQRSSFTFSALSAALPTPLAEGMRKKGTVRGAVAAASAPEFAVSRLPALRYPQQPTWAFWCASRSGTALQPLGLPALPGNGQAGSQWRGRSLLYLNRPAPFFHPPSPWRRRLGGASVSSTQRILGGTQGAAR